MHSNNGHSSAALVQDAQHNGGDSPDSVTELAAARRARRRAAEGGGGGGLGGGGERPARRAGLLLRTAAALEVGSRRVLHCALGLVPGLHGRFEAAPERSTFLPRVDRAGRSSTRNRHPLAAQAPEHYSHGRARHREGWGALLLPRDVFAAAECAPAHLDGRACAQVGGAPVASRPRALGRAAAREGAAALPRRVPARIQVALPDRLY